MIKRHATVIGQPIRLFDGLQYLASGKRAGGTFIKESESGLTLFRDGVEITVPDHRFRRKEIERGAFFEMWAIDALLGALRVMNLRSYAEDSHGDFFEIPTEFWFTQKPEDFFRTSLEFLCGGVAGVVVLREAEFMPWAAQRRLALPHFERAGNTKPPSGGAPVAWFHKDLSELVRQELERERYAVKSGDLDYRWPTAKRFIGQLPGGKPANERTVAENVRKMRIDAGATVRKRKRK
jgi:hypothetical protein